MRARQGWRLPLEEVSALCLWDDGASVVGVGDDHWCFARATCAPGALVPEPPTVVDRRPPTARKSEFEGIAGDASGRLFVLREGPSVVLVVDREGEVTQTLRLHVPAGMPRLGAEWNDAANANARGEGLLLLRDGHVLVAKQRKSPWIIEFGADGDAPQGFTRASALRTGEVFPLAAAVRELHALAAWRVDQPDLESLNDLAVDAGGGLFLISARSRRLARLDHDLDPAGGRARLVVHDLPEELFQSKDDKAEGLVHSPQLGWLVGLDLDREGDNVVQLTGVPPI